MMQHHDVFYGAYKKDLDSFVRKLGRDKKHCDVKRDPQLMKTFKNIGEDMADGIANRFGAYTRAYDLHNVAVEPHASHFVPSANQPRADGPPSSDAVAQLEAKLEQRRVEEDMLRSALKDRMTADSDAALDECNVELLQARPVVADLMVDVVGTTTKGEQLRQELEMNEAILSALASLSSNVDEERENNRRIENQLKQELHPVEAELLAPRSHGVFGDADEWHECEEDDRLAAQLEHDQKVRERMQRQFDDF